MTKGTFINLFIAITCILCNSTIASHNAKATKKLEALFTGTKSFGDQERTRQIKKLINAGADVSLVIKDGLPSVMTPLLYATVKGDVELVKFLLRKNADPNLIVDKRSIDVLAFAVVCYVHSKALSLLDTKPDRKLVKYITFDNLNPGYRVGFEEMFAEPHAYSKIIKLLSRKAIISADALERSFISTSFVSLNRCLSALTLSDNDQEDFELGSLLKTRIAVQA